jgi:hypothetical protein
MIMKDTSRRNFGKQMAGAFAALPLVSLLTDQRTLAQTKEKPRSREQIDTTHDTPPPVVIADGSLIIESEQAFDPPSGSGPYLYRGSGTPQIAHVRILHDNGDKLYEDLNAHGTEIKIIWKNEDNSESGNLVVKGGSSFVISCDKRLTYSSVSRRRRHKYDHPGSGGNKRIRIESIEITNRLKLKTTFTAPPFANASEFVPAEFRVLIWRHA